MQIKRIKNNQSTTLASFKVGDTFLFDNKVCMLIDRNGHPFPINLATGELISIKKTDELVKITCELQYKVG